MYVAVNGAIGKDGAAMSEHFDEFGIMSYEPKPLVMLFSSDSVGHIEAAPAKVRAPTTLFMTPLGTIE